MTACACTKQRVWIIDPIDGTRAYLGGREDWSISAALVEDGRPRLAAVFAPATDEFFFASKGGGAARNDATIKASPGAGIDIDRMAGPHFLLNRVRGTTSPELKNFKIGSLALRISRVAQGALDAAFVGGNSRDWDLAAADLLLQRSRRPADHAAWRCARLQSRRGHARGAARRRTRAACAPCDASRAALGVCPVRNLAKLRGFRRVAVGPPFA